MMINVVYTPTATYQLVDGTFQCQHDKDTETVEQTVDSFGFNEHDTYLENVTICADCREVL